VITAVPAKTVRLRKTTTNKVSNSMTKQNKKQKKANQLSIDTNLFQPITDGQSEVVKGGYGFDHYLCGKTAYLKSSSTYC